MERQRIVEVKLKERVADAKRCDARTVRRVKSEIGETAPKMKIESVGSRFIAKISNI